MISASREAHSVSKCRKMILISVGFCMIGPRIRRDLLFLIVLLFITSLIMTTAAQKKEAHRLACAKYDAK